jgi:hypothetical protein
MLFEEIAAGIKVMQRYQRAVSLAPIPYLVNASIVTYTQSYWCNFSPDILKLVIEHMRNHQKKNQKQKSQYGRSYRRLQPLSVCTNSSQSQNVRSRIDHVWSLEELVGLLEAKTQKAA